MILSSNLSSSSSVASLFPARSLLSTYFAGNELKRTYEPRHEKTCPGIFDQVRLKPACSATEAS